MPALTLGLAVAIAFSVITLSGVGGLLGHGGDAQIEEEFEGTAEESEDTDFDPDEGGDSLLGSTVAGLNVLLSMGSVLVFLPSSLQSIGMPQFGAQVLGHSIQLVFAIGIAQFVRGFEIR